MFTNLVLAALAVAVAVPLAKGDPAGEAAESSAILNEYAQFLSGLDSLDELTVEEKDYWVAAFQDGADRWIAAERRYSAWNAMIALHNALGHWELSLATIDEAIANTASADFVFEWQYDRWTVMQRLGQGQRAGGGRSRVDVARDDAIATYLRVRQAREPGRSELQTGTSRFLALAWSAINDQGCDRRAEVAQVLVDLGRQYGERAGIDSTMQANHIGFLIGLETEGGIGESVDLVGGLGSEDDRLVAVSVAMRVARDNGYSNEQLTSLLWSLSDQFRDPVCWLTLAVNHYNEVRASAKMAQDAPLSTGIASEELGGVLSLDLLNMIEPSVQDLLKSWQGRGVSFADSPEQKRSYAVLQSSLFALSDLLELMGDRQNAQFYQSKANHERMRSATINNHAP